MELIFLAELIISDATLLIELCRISIEFMLLLICQSSLFRSGQFTRQQDGRKKRTQNAWITPSEICIIRYILLSLIH